MFPHTDPGFYQLLAYECEQRHAVDLYTAHTNLHNTCKHMLDTDGSFLGIPMISGSFSCETLDRGTRRSTPVAFSVRGLTNGVFCS